MLISTPRHPPHSRVVYQFNRRRQIFGTGDFRLESGVAPHWDRVEPFRSLLQQSFFLINGHSALTGEREKTRSPTKFLSTYIIQCLVSRA